MLQTILWLSALLLFLLGAGINWANLPPLGVFLSPNEGYWQNAERVNSFSVNEKIEGISQEVEVVFDQRGVPHIFAQNISDASLALGYLHARDRYFQMDFTSRAAAGKLAEIIGKNALPYDREMRQKGMSLMIENIAAHWSENPEHVTDYLIPYIKGVNQYLSGLKRRGFPIELKLLHYSPEEWTRENTAAVISFLSHQLTLRHSDPAATHLYEQLGEEEYLKLFPAHFDDIPPVIPDEWNQSMTLQGNTSPSKRREYPVSVWKNIPQPGVGSNNWALGPQKTSDGSVMVANDPHLPLTLPSIWYECHIVTPEINQYGFSLPGIPIIYLGINENNAVGTTNVGMDYIDYYKINWTDETRRTFTIDGINHPIEWREELIGISDGQTILDSMPITPFGHMPFYNQPDHPLSNYAIYWRAIDPQGDQLRALSHHHRTNSVEDFIEQTRHLTDPPQNVVYGDNSGNIAMLITGSLPARRDPLDGAFLRDGSSLINFLRESIPFEYQPRSINPSSGFVASANQISTGRNYPYQMLGNFNLDRGTYLFNMLDSMQEIDLEDVMSLQNDNRSQKAMEITAGLLPMIDQSALQPEESELFLDIERWDHRFDAASSEAVFLKIWEKKLAEVFWETYRDSLGEDAKLPNWKSTLHLIANEPDHPFFKRNETHAEAPVAQLVTISFSEAAAEYFRISNESGQNPNWAEFRNASIPHIARIEAFGLSFLDSGGTLSSLNSIHNTSGPSMRMIARFKGDVREFYVSFPGGSSGNPGSKWYDNSLGTWINGGYDKPYIERDPEPLRKTSTGTIVLIPR